MEILLSLITAILSGLKDFSAMRPDRKKRLAQALLRLSRALDECHRAYQNYSQNEYYRQLQHARRNLESYRAKYQAERQQHILDTIWSIEDKNRERKQALRPEREAWQKAIKRLADALMEHQEILQIFDPALLERLRDYTFDEEYAHFIYAIESLDQEIQSEEDLEVFKELLRRPDLKDLPADKRIKKIAELMPAPRLDRYFPPELDDEDEASIAMKLRYTIEMQTEQEGSSDFDQAREALNAFIKEHTELADFF